MPPWRTPRGAPQSLRFRCDWRVRVLHVGATNSHKLPQAPMWPSVRVRRRSAPKVQETRGWGHLPVYGYQVSPTAKTSEQTAIWTLAPPRRIWHANDAPRRHPTAAYAAGRTRWGDTLAVLGTRESDWLPRTCQYVESSTETGCRALPLQTGGRNAAPPVRRL